MPNGIGRSFPVAMAATPGAASAFETSIETIRAWAIFERSSLQCSIRGSITSSANFVWPVTFAAPSTFVNGRPTMRVGVRFHLSPPRLVRGGRFATGARTFPNRGFPASRQSFSTGSRPLSSKSNP